MLDTRPDGFPVAPECAEAVRVSGRILESLGHRLEPGCPAALGDSTSDALFGTFWSGGMTAVLDSLARRLGREVTEADVEPLNWMLGVLGAEVAEAQRQAAVEGVAVFSAAVLGWWDEHDLLLTPTLAEPPLPVGALLSDAADPMAALERSVWFSPFTPFANFTGQPAISLPLHVTAYGLPVGISWSPRPAGKICSCRSLRNWRSRHPGGIGANRIAAASFCAVLPQRLCCARGFSTGRFHALPTVVRPRKRARPRCGCAAW